MPWRLVALGVLAVAVILAASSLDLADPIRHLRERVAHLGPWAPFAFIAVYVAATLLAVPGTPFTLASPLMFGPWPAFGIMVAASSLSASAAFLIARYAARDAVARALEGHPAFGRLQRLLDDHAWVIIPFVRVVPFPFALNNYGFGLTAVSFWRYLGWSEVGMVPMNALLVFGADTLLGGEGVSGARLGAIALAAAAVAALALAGRRAWAAGARAQSR